MDIKVGYMVAYDYELLKLSLPTVYVVADKIVLAMDKHRLTFKGENFEVDPAFFDWLWKFDVAKKISFYEDEFYMPGLSVVELETRTRNMLAKFMGGGGWHFQTDADEYFVDFEKVVADVKSTGERLKGQKLMFRTYWRTIFKRTHNGFFLVDGGGEDFALVTNYPVYEDRRYVHSIENLTLNHVVLHQSFGRSEEDLKQKFRNWSHADDFDREAYLNFWKSVDIYNYKYIYDFNATHPGHWMRLSFLEANSIEELLTKTPPHLNINDVPNHPRLRKWLPPVLYNLVVNLIHSKRTTYAQN